MKVKSHDINLRGGLHVAPRKSHKGVRIFYIACGVFFIVGIMVGIFSGSYEFIFAMSGFSAFLFFVIWHQSSAKGTIYHLSSKGLFLKRYFWKEFCPFNEIETMQRVSGDEMENLLNGLQKNEAFHSENNEAIEAFSNRLNIGKLMRYCTVNAVFSEQNGTNHRVSLDGDFVLLTLKSGMKYILSPESVEELMANYGKFSAYSPNLFSKIDI